jgi:endonuclease YncB( thermonuclease family)
MIEVMMLDSMVINRQDRQIGEVVTVDQDLGLHMIRNGWAVQHVAASPAPEDETPRRGGKRRNTYNAPELSTHVQPPSEES